MKSCTCGQSRRTDRFFITGTHSIPLEHGHENRTFHCVFCGEPFPPTDAIATGTFYVLDMSEATEVFEQTNGRKPTEIELQRMKDIFGNVMADGRIAEHMRLAAEEAVQ